ncbi:glycoside hydrolase family 92 protein [Streptococcus sp. O1]|uniref:glycoside hydrolase family 92 protein n=1 Tax=Streptococcus sp. O1 TaxID=2928735 RepID=UPI00211B393F|nr:glycoside hydrolase family 92 protein [Streptococcus sp. O1]
MEVSSHTIDYTYSDFCIATVAEALGHHGTAEEYKKQAQNYRHLFDLKQATLEQKMRMGIGGRASHPIAEGSGLCGMFNYPR